MRDVVIVEAVRIPVRQAQRWLVHDAPRRPARPRCSARVIERSGIDPAEVGQVVGGCVSQVGMQAFNITRNAWLAAGPAARGGRHHRRHASAARRSRPRTSPYALVASGVVDVAVACGVEVMSRVPMGATIPKDPDVGKPVNRAYFEHYEWTSQFEGAERIAEQVGHHPRGRPTSSASSRRSGPPRRGPRAASSTQIVPDRRPRLGDDGKPTARPTRVGRDEGLRETTLEKLAALKPVTRARTASTPRARRRRSPTAPSPCC